MGLGKRRESRQQELWIAADRLARTPRHVFYEKLNRVLAKSRFDAWVEELCRPYYAEEGRRSIPPGVYFRMLLVGYFEGIDSQRGIAWRCTDSLSLKAFLGYGPTESTPDHSSLTKIRERLPVELYAEVFQFVLSLVEKHKLLVAAHNLGLILRKLIGAGKPRAYDDLLRVLESLHFVQLTLQTMLSNLRTTTLWPRLPSVVEIR